MKRLQKEEDGDLEGVRMRVAARAWKGSLVHLWRRFEGFGGRNLKIHHCLDP